MTRKKMLAFGVAVLFAALGAAAAVADDEPQYVSASGKKYYPQQDSQGQVAEAQKKLDADPKSVALLIALGDAYGAVWNHKAAIKVYLSRKLKTKERQRFPKSLEGVPVETEESSPIVALPKDSKVKPKPSDRPPKNLDK